MNSVWALITGADLQSLNERLTSWAHKAKVEYGAQAVYLFGSLIHKGGEQFNSSSDVDLVVLMPGLPDAVQRHRWLESFGEHKEALEAQLMRTLRRAGTEPAASVVAVTQTELSLDVHKDGHRRFFSENTFRELESSTECMGIPGAGIRKADRFTLTTLGFVQKIRNEFFSVSANGTPNLTSYDGSDPLPKRLMRAAVMAARCSGQTSGTGVEHDVKEGLDFLSNRLYQLRDSAPAYKQLQDIVSVRRNARGAYKNVEATHQLLLSEILYDAVPNTIDPIETDDEPKEEAKSSEVGGASVSTKDSTLTTAIAASIAHVNDRVTRPSMPYASSTAFFAERFGSAFPGMRTTTWFNDTEEISVRLAQLLRSPLKFSDSIPIWWWRGGNLQIETFRKLEAGVFLMNIEELRIARLAAVPGNTYKRHFVYVQCEAMDSTGLYSADAEWIAERIAKVGYHDEEYGLFKGSHLLTRAEYDDGYCKIGSEIIATHSDSELRVRYTSPYNFIIAAHSSPVNNSDFDDTLEALLNLALKENPENVVEIIRANVNKLPAGDRFG